MCIVVRILLTIVYLKMYNKRIDLLYIKKLIKDKIEFLH